MIEDPRTPQLAAADASSTPKAIAPSIGTWVVSGALLVFVPFLALTGGLCAEGLVAMLLGGVAGGIWAAIARRRGWNRLPRLVGGLIVLVAVTLGLSAIDRSLAPGKVFYLAFGTSVDSSVTILDTKRFGFRDNTTLIVMKTDETSLSKLLTSAGFATYLKAEELVRPPVDDPRQEIDREKLFRLNVAGGGPFQNELPFSPNLRVWRRHDEAHRTFYNVLWDPDKQEAYLFLCQY